MSPVELELAYRAALRAVPDFRFGHDQLVRPLIALPPPPAAAPVAFRHRHLRGIIQEVRALDAVNPLDAMLVLQIAASRHAAADCAHRALDPTLSVQDVARLFRCIEMLERSTRRTERMLKKQWAGRVPVRQAPEGQVPGDQASGGQAPEGRAPAQVEFDVEALDAPGASCTTGWLTRWFDLADCDPPAERGLTLPQSRRRPSRRGHRRCAPPPSGRNSLCADRGSTW